MDMTAADLSNRTVFHKSPQTPNTAQTIRSGNFPYFPQQIADRAIHGETGLYSRCSHGHAVILILVICIILIKTVISVVQIFRIGVVEIIFIFR